MNPLRRTPIYLFLLAAGCAAPEVQLREPEKPSGPLSLEAAVELAWKNNPDVLAAAERVNEARAAIDEAASNYWPVLQLIERFTITDQPSQAFANILDQRRFKSTLDFNDPGVVPNFRTGLAGSITLYDGGRRRARLRGARAQAESLEALEEKVRRDLALEIARAWYLVHKARDTAATQEKSIDILSAHLKISEARLAAGAARRSDVLAVNVRLAESKEASITARNSAVRAEAALHLLLGLGIEEPIQLLPPPSPALQAPGKLEDLLAQARKHRLELAQSERDIAAARAKWIESHAGYQPEITLFGGFGFDDREPALGHANWLWGVGFIESVFDALRTPNRVRQAKAGLKAALSAFRKAQLEVELEVKNSLLDAEEADAKHDVAAQAATLAEESLRLVEAEYQQGAATITRLLDAELSLTQARTRLLAAAHDRALSRISILHAVGEYPAAPTEPPASKADSGKETHEKS
ncbi:MAG: TolC family protein [Planctomycetes bacterium]|nr:TolC family protein [Planctomycetota bacterium]